MKYKTINGYTKQKMIDQIYAKNNGKKSVNSAGNCVYRSTDLNCCAAGCFIPDEYYSEKMEEEFYYKKDGGEDLDSSIYAVIAQFPNIAIFMPIEIEGMKEFQNIHDSHNFLNTDIRIALKEWIENNVTDE